MGAAPFFLIFKTELFGSDFGMFNRHNVSRVKGLLF